MKNKVYFTKANLNPDKDCSLLPPVVLYGEETKTRHYHPDYRGWQSAPCIVCTPKGRLYCTFSGDNSLEPDETPNNYNLICVSDDGGKTWRDGEWIIDHPDSVRMHEPLLWMAPDGAMWTFWAQSYNWWDGRGGLWAMRCADPDAEKIVWEAPRRLCDGVMATPPICAKNGEWFFPVSIWKCFPSEYNSLPELSYSNVYVSRDCGKTLEYVGSANEPDTTFDENCLVEREDGSFLMLMRTTDAIASSESFDRCKTWSKPIRMMDSPSSRSYLGKFPSGNLLLIAHDDFMTEVISSDGNAMNQAQRKNMTAFLSEDGGKTWPYHLLLNEQINVSYPAGMITPEGRVYVAHDHERYADREVYYSSFTEEEVRRGEILEQESFRKKLVCKSGRLRERQGKVYESGEGKSAQKITVREVFEQGKFFDSCHASTLVKLGEKRYAVACFGGSAEGNNDVKIWMSLQDEHGVFGEPICFQGPEELPCWNPVLFRGGNGGEQDELVLYFKYGKPIAEWRTLVSVSKDNGKTWSKPEELIPGDRSGGRGPVKNKPIRLSNGVWLAPMSTEMGGWNAGIDRSEDGGKTWERVMLEMEPLTERAQKVVQNLPNAQERTDFGLIQPTLWESECGHVHALMRSSYGRIYRSDSEDYGKTWCPAYETDFPNNNSGIDAVKWGETVVLVCNPVEGNWAARSPLSVYVSKDNGKTFRLYQVLEEEPGEYSYPAVIVDGNDLLISYTWQRKNIRLVRLIGEN